MRTLCIAQASTIVYFIGSWTFLIEMVAEGLAAVSLFRFLLRFSTMVDIVTIIAGFGQFWGGGDIAARVNFARFLRIFQVLLTRQ
jgi:hypothetical protein